MNASTRQPSDRGWYEIRLDGRLDPRWSAVLDGRTRGRTRRHHRPPDPVVDQAALHGLLAQVRDIGLPLLSVVRVEPEPAPHPTRAQKPS